MANMRNHDVVETYRSSLTPNDVYHVTKNDRVVRTTGPKGGGAKILFVTPAGKFNFSGMGRRATATEFRPMLEKMGRVK